jgi:hypothetical protein
MTSYPCPVCLTEANLETGCPGCGRPPDPLAAEVIGLDRKIEELKEQTERSRQAYADVWTQLQVAQRRRARLAAQVWSQASRLAPDRAVAPHRPALVAQASAPAVVGAQAPAPAVVGAQAPAPAVVGAPAQARPEASTQTVKNVLFVLGGILVGIAAIVFTAFAWGTFGMAGKAAILAVITGIVLAVPLMALRSGLRGTAETFAAIGLLLVLLDGYSVWRVDLAAVQSAFSGWTYTGLIAAVTASLALGYAWLTSAIEGTGPRLAMGLAGPAISGLLLAQPVLPLLFADVIAGRSGGFAIVFGAVAVANLLVAWGLRRERFADRPLAVVLQVIAWSGYALSLLLAHVFAFLRLAASGGSACASQCGPEFADLVIASALLLFVGAIGIAAGGISRVRALSVAGTAWFVVLLLIVQARFADLLDPAHVLLWTCMSVALLAAALAAARPFRTAAAWLGALIGVLIGGGLAALIVVGDALRTGSLSLLYASPWRTSTPAVGPYEWPLPVELALLTSAACLLLFGATRVRRELVTLAAMIGVSLMALAAPGRPPVAAWLVPVVDLAVSALLLAVLVVMGAARRESAPPTAEPARGVANLAVRLVTGLAAAALVTHALVASTFSTSLTAWTLAAVVGLAAATATAAALTGDRTPGVVAVAVSPPLLVLLAVAVAKAAGASDVTALHGAALTAAALPAGAWALRQVAQYARTAEISAWTTIVVTVYVAVVSVPADGWTKSLYVSCGLLAIALLSYVPVGEREMDGWKIAGWSALVVALAMARPPMQVFVESYRWLAEGWGAAPGGVGLAPGSETVVTGGDVLAFAILTLAVGVDWYAWTRNLRGALLAAATFAPIPAVLGLVWLGVRWPGVPLVMLVAGLARLVRTGLGKQLRALDGLVIAYAALIGGSGLAGLSVTSWSSILGLSLVTVAFAVIGCWGGTRQARWVAWPLAGVAWTALAVTCANAAHLGPRPAVLVVLAAAAALLAASMLPWRAELRALEPLAHLVAVGCLISAYAAGSAVAARSAEIYLGWGLAIGVTVFTRRRSTVAREWLVRLSIAGLLEILALWSMLWASDVRAVEAYSLPVAAVALLVGFLAMRRDPALTSWAGYAPALIAAFGPSLLAVLPGEGDPVRRLTLGVGALAVVIAGSIRRRQAPVVIGGLVLVVLALHELTLYWTKLPLWLPIGVGGAILIGLAITYERRLRDLRSLRATLAAFR